jgi:hypothetical protein
LWDDPSPTLTVCWNTCPHHQRKLWWTFSCPLVWKRHWPSQSWRKKPLEDVRRGQGH